MKKIGIALTLLLCLLLLGGCTSQRRTYRQAQHLMDTKQYAQAVEHFESLGDYADARDKARACKYLLAQACAAATPPDIPQAVRLYADLGGYADAREQLEALEDAYFYPEYDRRIPALETVLPDAKRAESDGKDDNGAFRRYVYSWLDPDDNALANGFTAWMAELDAMQGVDAVQHLNGAYLIAVDGERVGVADTLRLDDAAQIRVTLYTDPIR